MHQHKKFVHCSSEFYLKPNCLMQSVPLCKYSKFRSGSTCIDSDTTRLTLLWSHLHKVLVHIWILRTTRPACGIAFIQVWKSTSALTGAALPGLWLGIWRKLDLQAVLLRFLTIQILQACLPSSHFAHICIYVLNPLTLMSSQPCSPLPQTVFGSPTKLYIALSQFSANLIIYPILIITSSVLFQAWYPSRVFGPSCISNAELVEEMSFFIQNVQAYLFTQFLIPVLTIVHNRFSQSQLFTPNWMGLWKSCFNAPSCRISSPYSLMLESRLTSTWSNKMICRKE